MRTARLIFSALTSSFIVSGICPDAAVGGTCPPMNLDRRGSPTLPFNEEVVSFSFRSKTYPVAVFSGFTRQDASRISNSNFCIRYEVENKSHQDAIEKFYWPMAGIQLDTINPHQRPSLAITKPPGRDPTVEETWLYAFLNATARTFAFQSRAELEPPYRIIRAALRTDDKPQQSDAKNRGRYDQYSAIDAVQQQFFLKEPTTYAEVGAEFSNGDASQVSSTSLASWDGQKPQITVRFTRADEKTSAVTRLTIDAVIFFRSA
jgi:hypothetical protein